MRLPRRVTLVARAPAEYQPSGLSFTSQFWEVADVLIWSAPTRAVGVSLMSVFGNVKCNGAVFSNGIRRPIPGERSPPYPQTSPKSASGKSGPHLMRLVG